MTHRAPIPPNTTPKQVDCRSHFDGMASKPILAMQSCAHGSPETYLGQCKCAGLDAGCVPLCVF